MPRGEALLESLRDEHLVDASSIVVTTTPDPIRDQPPRRGVGPVLLKPFQIDALYDAVASRVMQLPEQG